MDAAHDRAAKLHLAAVEDYDLGHPAQARRKLLDARRFAGESEDVAEALRLNARISITLALVDSELFGSAAGLTASELALELARSTEDAELIVPATGQLGLILMRLGQYRRAAETFGDMRGIIDRGLPSDQYAALLNMGTAYLYLGEFGASHSALSRALDVATASGIASGVFKATHNLGYLEFLRGDIPRALAQMDAALAVNPGITLGVALLDRARVLIEAGLVNDADRALAGAAEIFATDRRAQDLGEAELERARCALIAADMPAARRYAGRARTRFARHGSQRWRQSAELVLLQADLAAGRPGRRLIGPARRLSDELAAEGLGVLARTARLIAAEAALAAGDIADAEHEVRRLGRESRHDPVTYRLHAAVVRAQFDAARGRRAPAAARVSRGLDDLAAYQAGFGSLDLSTAAAVHGRRLVELDMRLAVESGRVPAIFAAAERGRAVTSRLAPVRPPDDPVTAELLADLRQTVESLRGVELDATRAAPLAKRRAELESQIAQRAWSRPGAHAVTASAGIDDVQAALGDRSLVMFVASGDAASAVVVTSTGVRHQALGGVAEVRELVRRARADLDVLAQPRLPAPIAAAVRASFDHTVDSLDAVLLRPLGVTGRRVLITTGLLGQLPWGCLPSLRGVPHVVAPSATAWLSANEAPARRGGPRLVSLAGPGLVRAEEEARHVAAQWGIGRTVTGALATGAALATAMASARVVHIAAHGTHQTENPLFSSVRLADGPFFAHELDQAAGTPEQVVLSACELGLATVRPGDEALGLTSVLLRLGTRSVVAGVARIADDLAAETMSAYHQLLVSGRDSASALAEACARSDRPVPLVGFGAEWTLRPH